MGVTLTSQAHGIRGRGSFSRPIVFPSRVDWILDLVMVETRAPVFQISNAQALEKTV